MAKPETSDILCVAWYLSITTVFWLAAKSNIRRLTHHRSVSTVILKLKAQYEALAISHPVAKLNIKCSQKYNVTVRRKK